MNYNPQRSNLRGAQNLGQLYGINYDENAIRGVFDRATSDEYALKRKEYQQTENDFYNKMYNTQGAALDTIRKSNASAVATGASRGIQAAQELSATLGLQQQSVADATKLAQQRNLLNDQEAAAYSKNVVNAMNSANALKTQLGTLDSQLYTADTQFDVGQMQYYAQLDAAAKQLQGMLSQADASRYAADQNLKGADLTSARGLEGSKYTADQNRLATEYATERGTRYTADQNRLAQEYMTERGTRYAAELGFEGTKFNANKNYDAQIGAANINAGAAVRAAGINAGATSSAAAAQLANSPIAQRQYFENQFANAYQQKDTAKLADAMLALGRAKDYQQALEIIASDKMYNPTLQAPVDYAKREELKKDLKNTIAKDFIK